MKTLIVEDDPVSSQVLEKMMARHGSIDVVHDGGQAVERFRQAQDSGEGFSLVLMDIMMPEVNGLESVQEIRAREKATAAGLSQRVKIIMTTALNDPRTLMKALYESDADSYLVKPITLDRLDQELRSLKLIG